MDAKKKILLKLTGDTLSVNNDAAASLDIINAVAQQIKTLEKTHLFGIVIGGGNFFRGTSEGEKLDLTPAVGHQIGMLATLMNGLIVRDVFEKQNLNSTLVSSLTCPSTAPTISQQRVDDALRSGHVLIFAGGTGAPFFTTDTNAIVRALQMGARQVWKATDVDGVYDADPHTYPEAQFIKEISYADAIKKGIRVMDAAAFALASEHKLLIRVFNIFEKNALIQAVKQPLFGSKIS